MKTIQRLATSILVFAALGTAACAASSDDAQTEESVAAQPEGLRNGGGDPDACMAALGACYHSCATSGSADCYRYCDIVYAKCRGLPPPELIIGAARSAP